MPNLARRLRRQKNAMHRRWREFTMIVRGVVSTDHPVQAHIVPIRRCNLACTYCNEYDDFSKPVATSEMLDRVDNLARLVTTLIVITGQAAPLHSRPTGIIHPPRPHRHPSVLPNPPHPPPPYLPHRP